MTEARRNLIEGGSFFFTVNLEDRSCGLLVEHVANLRSAVRETRARMPFRIDAWVVLPDHMHCVWTLPPGDADYPARWKSIKILFSKSLPKTEHLAPSRVRRGERGIWQRRYWEHTIRDDRDFETHVNYVHLNPVKHGLVQSAKDWPYSSFHKYVAAGIYSPDWMGG
ncbi:MAG: REP-associated tyrosine transposase [Telluria sp.]